MTNKRKDPNYALVSGRIPKKMAIAFKVKAKSQRITFNEALEKALIKWLKDQEDDMKWLEELSKGH